jgi:hypothetical protein
MRFLRNTTVAWLLVAFSACYALPVGVAPRARAQSCCTSHACCHKKSAGHTSGGGSFFTASAECGGKCPLPAGLAAHTSPLLASRAAAPDTAAISDTLRGRPIARSGLTSYFAFLYQRPPPFQF